MSQSPTHLVRRRLVTAAAATLIAAATCGALLLGAARSSRAAPGDKPAGKGPLKIAFAYVGPVGDAGWTFAHDKARKAVEAEFGAKVVTSFVENVPEAADAERVLRDMVAQGNQLIFGTTFGYMVPMMKVATDAKDVKFEHATGYKTAENLRTYDSRTFEGAYLAGVVAGSMTKTKILGVVASIPIPEVIRNIDSFTLGSVRDPGRLFGYFGTMEVRDPQINMYPMFSRIGYLKDGRGQSIGPTLFSQITRNFTLPDDLAAPKRVTVVKSQVEMIRQICEESGGTTNTCAL